MSGSRSNWPAIATAAALALLPVAGLTACGGGPGADDEIAPVLLTEGDGTVRGPATGADPVEPPDPAPAGNPETDPEIRRQEERASATEDDPAPPPPPPPSDDEDDDVEDEDDVEDGDDSDVDVEDGDDDEGAGDDDEGAEDDSDDGDGAEDDSDDGDDGDG